MQEVEYIFVDDASPDNSMGILNDILSQYPSRKDDCIILRHEVNKGLAAARNTGLRVARGEYIFHHDSDDYIEREGLAVLYEKACEHKADAVLWNFFMDFCERTEVCSLDHVISTDKLKFLRNYIAFGWNTVYSCLVKKEVYLKNNLFSYEGYTFCEDYGLLVRVMYYASSVVYLNKAFYHYDRTNISSIVNTSLSKGKREKNTNDEITICCFINDFFKRVGIYKDLEEVLSWRMLKAKRGLLDTSKNRGKYMALYPESNQYIHTNPFCSRKDVLCQRIVMSSTLSWLLDVISFINRVRIGLLKG